MTKNDSITDSALIAAYCKGNQEALGVLHQRMAQLLFIRGYRLCEDDAMAADCVSDLFEQLLNYSIKERKAIFRGMEDENVKAWLYTAVKNKIFSSLRKRLNQRIFLGFFDKLLRYAQFNNQIDTYEGDFERLAVMLSEREKTALKLHLEGYSYKDIASEMQVSTQTIKKHLISSRKTLKNIKEHL